MTHRLSPEARFAVLETASSEVPSRWGLCSQTCWHKHPDIHMHAHKRTNTQTRTLHTLRHKYPTSKHQTWTQCIISSDQEQSRPITWIERRYRLLPKTNGGKWSNKHKKVLLKITKIRVQTCSEKELRFHDDMSSLTSLLASNKEMLKLQSALLYTCS